MGGKESKQFPLTYDEAVKRGKSGFPIKVKVKRRFSDDKNEIRRVEIGAIQLL